MEKENLCVSPKGEFKQHIETYNRNLPAKGTNVPESGKGEMSTNCNEIVISTEHVDGVETEG